MGCFCYRRAVCNKNFCGRLGFPRTTLLRQGYKDAAHHPRTTINRRNRASITSGKSTSLASVQQHTLTRFPQSFYSLCLNRRHSAYTLAGSAVRLAVVMGLHLNVPTAVLPDATMREHRCRVWWTAYTFDRMWSAKLGFPRAISDTVIEVDLPSNLPENADQEDIPDCSYLVAMIGLARLTSRTMSSIYGSAAQKTSLSQRVQSALTDLRRWKDELPESLMIKNMDNAASDSRACYLQLMFNQVKVPAILHILTPADCLPKAAYHLHAPNPTACRSDSPHTATN